VVSARAVAFVACVAALTLAGAGCQLVLGIDTNVPIVDGGASADGGGGEGGRGCDGAAILCDDFEGTTIDSARWPILDQTGGSVTIDATHTNDGSRGALHAHTDAVTQTGAAAVAGFVVHRGALPAHFFVRFFAYVASPAARDTPEILMNLQKDPGGMQLYVANSDLGFTSWANQPSLNAVSDAALVLDAWHCIEWEVIEGSGQIGVWLDNNVVQTLSLSNVVTPPYDQMKLGLAFGSPPVQSAFDVWLDDLRVETTQVGCSR
jgi:hypothetical protein